MKPFLIHNKERNTYPMVVSLPHSGTWLPETMKKSLYSEAVLANTDWFLPKLYEFLVAKGCTVIENQVNRYVADPNRGSQMFGQDYQTSVVYQYNTFGHKLYNQQLEPQTIEERLTNYYWPYHQALQELINTKRQFYQKVYLLDLHSFAEYPNQVGIRPADLVVGNQADQSSSAGFRQLVTSLLEAEDYAVSNNQPFRGGFITKFYGDQPHIEALQLEIRYQEYIEARSFGEEVLTKYNPALFHCAQRRLEKVFEKLLESISKERRSGGE